MGADKALLRFDADGPVLIERVIAVARAIADEVVIIAPNDRNYQQFGVPVVADRFPGEGPLGGIATALAASSRAQTFVLSCDHPLLSVPLLRWLSELPPRGVVMVEQLLAGRHYRYPLLARYDRAALHPIEKLLANGERRALAVLDVLDVRLVREAELVRFDPGLRSLISVNTPEYLGIARALINEGIFANARE